jgi:hypothetical protein
MLEVWWDYLMSYSLDILDSVHFVFVDDASTTYSTMVPQVVADRATITAYRIDQNIPWNQPGARNLAMKHVNGWVLATDPDHVPSENLLRALVNCDFKRGHFYHPMRHRNMTKEPIKLPPTNVFVIHTDDFWATGGYDEDFCGRKGFSDLMLLVTMQEGCGFTQEWLDRSFSIDCYCEALILRKSSRDAFGRGQECSGYMEKPDAAVMTLDRNMNQNKNLRGEKLNRARDIGWSSYIKEQKPVRFPWHKVAVF